ncbi:DUF262 domain-containing protein [Candidatus Poribacteria bacterium]|nr:DUF262 domain-containing protein [Candidatus Poribacteria bacterium]
MQTQKYSVNQQFTETILAWVNSGEIAVPEIQRPIVWDSTKVRNLMDSLYQGYPIGYLIVWRNPNIRLKDGSRSEGKKILIDGQQRIMALISAILGKEVVNKEYQKIRIKIAFNPIEERFEVFNTAIARDPTWIQDISPIINNQIMLYDFVDEYNKRNPEADKKKVWSSLENLKQIMKKQIGLIELEPELDIETVTEIFIRINSEGVPLSQADFAMSKIASNETYGGSTLRKLIDYFSHLVVAPEFFDHIKNGDKDFAKTDYFPKIEWLKNENDDLYDPSYADLLRVAFTYRFNRGRLADLVSLLSGRNFETRTYEEEIAQNSFDQLEKGILDAINETSFKRFLMIIRSAGFISSGMIRSQNTLNFAYILYLKLKSQNYNPADIEKYVRRWFVLSILTGRYSGASESQFDFDIKNISNRDFGSFLRDVESADLSDAYWNAALIQSLNTSVASSPYFNVYLAAQVKANDKGFLSKDITVNDLITHRGDIHHIFPRDYLKSHGLKRGQYNQIANYVYMQSEINIKIGKKPPKVYFEELLEQCGGGELKYGGIDSTDELTANLKMNCVPESVINMEIQDYEEFLEARRKLISQKIKTYYQSL